MESHSSGPSVLYPAQLAFPVDPSHLAGSGLHVARPSCTHMAFI